MLDVAINLFRAPKHPEKPIKKNNKSRLWLKKVAQTGYATFIGIAGASIDLTKKITNNVYLMGIAIGVISICSGGIKQASSLMERSQHKKLLKQYSLNIAKALDIEHFTDKQIENYMKQCSNILDTTIKNTFAEQDANITKELSTLKEKTLEKPLNNWKNLFKHNLLDIIVDEKSFEKKTKNITKNLSLADRKVLDNIQKNVKIQKRNKKHKRGTITKNNIENQEQKSRQK